MKIGDIFSHSQHSVTVCLFHKSVAVTGYHVAFISYTGTVPTTCIQL